MAWACWKPECGQPNLDLWAKCKGCGAQKLQNFRAAAPPVPEAVAVRQALKLQGDYLRWPPIPYGGSVGESHQLIMQIQAEPAPRTDEQRASYKEPDEMRMLIDMGWVKVEEGIYQREIEPATLFVMGDRAKAHYFNLTGKTV